MRYNARVDRLSSIDVDFKLDLYTLVARIAPVYLTAVPVVLAFATVLPDGLNLPLAEVSGLVFILLSYFMGQVAADFGRRMEPTLWHSWGGPPTTRFLRHDNQEYNCATRALVHARLRALGLDIPTDEEERSNEDRACRLYESAIDYLRGVTRDPKRFPLVNKSNIEYGFRRNLLVLKPIGLLVTTIALVMSGWTLYHGWHIAGVIPPVAISTGLLNACVALIWLTGVRATTVRVPADRYARSLLEAAFKLDIVK